MLLDGIPRLRDSKSHRLEASLGIIDIISTDPFMTCMSVWNQLYLGLYYHDYAHNEKQGIFLRKMF